jgi:hypothetical protein
LYFVTKVVGVFVRFRAQRTVANCLGNIWGSQAAKGSIYIYGIYQLAYKRVVILSL